MLNKDLLPAISKYTKALADTIVVKKGLNAEILYENSQLIDVTKGLTEAYSLKLELEKVLESKPTSSVEEISMYYKEKVLPLMDEIRTIIDGIEAKVDKSFWPYPSYGDLLFGVR